jgi:hypothetical protein
MPKQPPRTWLISIGSGFRVWAFFLSIFAYFFISKHGLVLAYLKSSNLLWVVLMVWLTYITSMHVENYFRKNHFHFYYDSWPYAIGKNIFPIAFFLLLFAPFTETRPDKILLAKITNIPRAAFSPCSNLPLSPEVEKIARQVFNLKERDSFQCDSESDEGEALGW